MARVIVVSVLERLSGGVSALDFGAVGPFPGSHSNLKACSPAYVKRELDILCIQNDRVICVWYKYCTTGSSIVTMES